MVIGGTIEVSQRSAAVDAVRVLGITAVVAGHVWTESELIRALLYTWHVPIFFFLTGYLWTARRPVAVEVRKRWRSLALPYLSWLVLVSVLFLPWQYFRGDGLTVAQLIAPLLGGTYVGRPFSAFWFMGALFTAALIYRLLQALPLWIHWLIGIAGFTVGYVAPAALSAVPLGAGIAIPALIFIVAGNSLRVIRGRLNFGLVSGLALLALSGFAVATGATKALDLKQLDLGTPVLSFVVAVAISVGLVLIGEAVVPKLGSVFSTVSITLAGVGTMVILTHAVVLWVLRTPAQGTWSAFGVTLLLAWAAALFSARTPLAPLLIGAPRAEQRFLPKSTVRHSAGG
jgi:fucose 4-O-acetylase-like acetyltransferase